MDKRLNYSGRINSKKVYYVNGKAFISDKGTRNGKQKAEAYCYENLINSKDIIVFDSEMEFKYYLYLLERGIKNIEIHKNFLLLDSFYSCGGKYHDKIIYEADFVYQDHNGLTHVVDVKGFVEDVFYLKRKLFDFVYQSKGLSLEVVRFVRGERVNIEEFKEPKKIVKKQKEELIKLKSEKHAEEIKQNKINRLKNRYKELSKKEKLTKKEAQRLEEIKSELIKSGLIL